MTNKTKTLYILSMIFLALAVISGGIAISGFFFDNSMLQLVGFIILIISYVTSLILDIVYKKKNGIND